MTSESEKALSDGLNGIWTVGTGSLGTGLASLIFTYPTSCTISSSPSRGGGRGGFDPDVPFDLGDYYGRTSISCQNLLGMAPLSEEASLVVAFCLTVAVGAVFFLVWMFTRSAQR